MSPRYDLNSLSWHAYPWKAMLGQGLERIGHATLLLGPAGVGKRLLATRLARLLLCEAPLSSGTTAEACGGCAACHWLDTESHPDFRRLAPTPSDDAPSEGEGRKKRQTLMIRLPDVSALDDFVYVGSHRHGRRVVVIDEVDQANLDALNKLLKILEEPPANVYFVLTSSNDGRLPATVRSRCRQVTIPAPSREDGEAWLRAQGAESRATRFLDVAGGAPLLVVDWQANGLLAVLEQVIDSIARARDPLALAKGWNDLLQRESALTMETIVLVVQRWVADMALIASGVAPRFHARWPLPAANQVPTALQVLRGGRELLRFRRSARHPLNQQLFLEELAMYALRAIRAEAPREVA